MKTLRLFSAVIGLAAAGSLHASDPAAPVRTDVVFDHPENFIDVKDSAVPTDRGRDAILSRIRSFLVDDTSRMIPEGYKLTVTFTNIDLAGDFEPARGPQFADIRIVRSIDYPSFKFTYSVRDPSGKVVREGSENIRDVGFEMRNVLNASDGLRYEKDILDDWARSALAGLKKA